MFVTKDEICQTIHQIINDNVNNDIVFIIANKGFGKYKLLNEIMGLDYQRNIIIANGDYFYSDSLLKNCLMQGIYEFLRRNNSIFQRHRLSKLISKSGKGIPVTHRIFFNFHVKLTKNEVEGLLMDFSLNLLVDIYKEFSFNSPLVFFIRGTELSDNDILFLSKFNFENNKARFNYIIALRPDSKGIRLIKNVTQYRNERIWIYPLIPTIRKLNIDSKIIKIPLISLNEIEDKNTFGDFKAEIVKKNYYNPVFKMVANLLKYAINPSMIFAIAKQEISYHDFDYINLLCAELLSETKITSINNALIAYNGNFVWVDAFAYYLFVNEGLEDIIFELQKFYFALIIDINEQKKNGVHAFSTKILSRTKEEQNEINNFLKKMSQLSINPLIPEITEYVARFSAWVRIFSKPAISNKSSPRHMDSLLNELYTFRIVFSNINLNALRLINNETCNLCALDIGLFSIANKLQTHYILTNEECNIIHSFITDCLNESLRWNDTTLMEEICEVLNLLIQNKMLGKYYISHIFDRYSYCYLKEYIDCYLKKYIENKNLKIGEIIMKNITIFISYTAADAEVVNAVENYLLDCGYDVKRDIRDIKDYDSINDFMNGIRKQDYVIPIVSDNYLRRNNCMYEIMQLLKDDNFSEKTFPIIIDFSKTSERPYNFFDIQYRIEITSFWENQEKELKNAINKISLENNVELANEYRLIKNYAQTVSVFLEWLKSKLVGVISADSDSVKIQSTAYDIVINIDKIISKK